MGRTLQKTAVSLQIKERLDFSCAIFDTEGLSLLYPCSLETAHSRRELGYLVANGEQGFTISGVQQG